MNASLLSHLVFQYVIDHAVSGWLILRCECVGCDDDSIGMVRGVFMIDMSGNGNLKWVSFDWTPSIALWCECKWESLYISRVVGLKASTS